jgi:hypothetical protein
MTVALLHPKLRGLPTCRKRLQLKKIRMLQETNQLEGKVHQRECRRGRAGDLSGARQLKEFQTAMIVQRLVCGAERGKT